MFEHLYQLPPKKVAAIEWTGDPLHYDFQLFRLGQRHTEFWVINPNNNIPEQWDTDLKFYVDTIPDTRKCVVLSYQGEWIVKIFKQDWYPYHGYEQVEIVKPKTIWSYNSAVDKQITFEDNPYGLYEPSPWEKNYQLVWYMDPRFNPLDEDVWVFSCQPVEGDILGTKHMGYIIPDIEVSFNDVLPDLGVDINECCPPYWDLIYECAYDLDNKHISSADKRLWVIKFKPMWGAPKDWKWIGTISPEYTVILNPALPDLPYDIDYVIPWHDFKFEHVWMLDRKHLRNDEDDIWAFTIQVSSELDGSKIIDYVSPVAEIIYNPDLPHMAYDIDYVIPWHDFKYKHVWMIDRKHLLNGEDDIWAFTIHVSNKPNGSKTIDYVSPVAEIIYNPDLPKLSYDIDYVIPWHDFKYEHVWMIDRKHLLNGEDDIWAFTMQVSGELDGSKTIDYVSPIIKITYNPDLPKLSYDIDYVIPWHDFKYEHVWMLDRSITNQTNIWALSATAIDDTAGVKQIDTLLPNIAKQLDVIFISYYELNAEDNWQRVLEKAPWAKRVDKVTGIFEAHKAAAKLAKSDMFYVVDGDAYLSDDWQFDFQPNVFDRDCTYVWHSINPVNGLTYGFGGVKLFSKSKIQYLKSWGTDLTLSVSKKLKVINTISNITKFNTSDCATWRTAFRECAKLSKKEDAESNKRLQAWLNPDVTAEYYKWAKLGAEQGNKYALSQEPISNINDYNWLNQQFKIAIKQSNTFCILPWIHFYANPDGDVLPCCIGDYTKPLGNVQQNSISEIWNNDRYKSMRLKMLTGKKCDECSACYQNENANVHSFRQTSNAAYLLESINLVNDTNQDGSLETMELKYLDIRWSNICNFKCRSCSSTYSSSWATEDNKQGKNKKVFIFSGGKNNDSLFDQLRPHITGIKEIYFAGGEPLLMDKHYEILEYLINTGNTNIKIRYNSNLSSLTFKNLSVIELWKKFSNIHLNISLDSWGSRAEYIREGTDWPTVVQNIKKVKESCPHIFIGISSVISVFNVYTIPEFIDYMIKNNFVDDKTKIRFYNIINPNFYSFNIINADIKNNIKDKLLDKIKTMDLLSDSKYSIIKNQIKNVISQLDVSSVDEIAQHEFKENTEHYDTIRNKKFIDTFPELAEFYTNIKIIKAQ